MPFPKLSAALNNCSLHAVTPELKDEIIKFGEISDYNNNHNDDYELLKSKFAAFYNIESENFTWGKFANILKNYNAFDIQIIMGPVLRKFMADKMNGNEFVQIVAEANYKDVDEYIKGMTEVNPQTGRYESLAPDEVFTYIGQYLGLSIQYFKNGRGETSNSENAIATIQMYHQGGLDGAQAGGHWERTHGALNGIDFEQKEDTKLKSLLPLLGNDNDINIYGFNLLKKHIYATANADKDELIKLDISAKQIGFCIKALIVLTKERVLVLFDNGLTDEAKKFLDEYIPVLQEREPIYEQWFLATSDKKPELLPQEKEVIDNLISPPIPVSGRGQEEFEEQFEIQSEISLPQKGNQVRLKKNELLKPEPIKGVDREEIEEESEQKAKILKALHVFKNKINDIGEHYSEAKEFALILHKNLINLVNESLGDKKYFVTQTKALVDKAIPTLQRDLGWGDYLTNLAKEICNIETKAASFGFHGGFFDTKKSNAVKETEKLQDEVLSTQSFLEIK
jgi:hypothetical protein